MASKNGSRFAESISKLEIFIRREKYKYFDMCIIKSNKSIDIIL